MFTIYQLVHFLIIDLEKYKSELLIIKGDFFFSDPQITKDWIYPQIIKAIKKVVANFIILVFYPTRLSNLVNYK